MSLKTTMTMSFTVDKKDITMSLRTAMTMSFCGAACGPLLLYLMRILRGLVLRHLVPLVIAIDSMDKKDMTMFLATAMILSFAVQPTAPLLIFPRRVLRGLVLRRLVRLFIAMDSIDNRNMTISLVMAMTISFTVNKKD